MNQAQWEAIAAPIILALVAVLEEFSLEDLALEDFGDRLQRRYRAAGQRRDPEALRQVCLEIRAAALRRMMAGEQDLEEAA